MGLGSEIRDPRSEIRDPRSGIRYPRSGIRDSGSGIRKKPIPDPGPGVKKAPDPGSRIRIRNTVFVVRKEVPGRAVRVPVGDHPRPHLRPHLCHLRPARQHAHRCKGTIPFLPAVCGPMTFWYVPGSADPCFWLINPDLFLDVHLQHFSMIKSQKKEATKL